MAWTKPALQDIINRMENDAQARLTGDTALLRYAVVRVLIRVFAGAIYMVYGAVEYFSKVIMPDTAVTQWLDRHGYIWGVERKAAAYAEGQAIFTGTNGEAIPQETELQDENGIRYITQVGGVIINGYVNINIQAKFPGTAGNITDGKELTIISPLDGIDDTVHTGIYELSYDNLIGGNFSEGDTLINTTDAGEGLVLSDNGTDTMTIIILSGSFADDNSIENTTGVTAKVNGTPENTNVISGGQDQESDDAYRARILFRIRSEPAGGTAADFERWAREVEGVGNAWCLPATPTPGYARILIRGVSSIEVSLSIQNNVLSYCNDRKPVTSTLDVQSVDKVEITFTIARPAAEEEFELTIEDRLIELFNAIAEPGTDIRISKIRNAISTTGISDYEITEMKKDGVSISIDNISLSGKEYPTVTGVTFEDL
jgi:uncharacterized phage protein gp47/JayE